MKKNKFENRNFKENIVTYIKNILFGLSSVKVKFTDDELMYVKKKLNRLIEDVDCVTGTGKEDVYITAKECLECLKLFEDDMIKGYKQAALKDLASLENSINKYCAILNGDFKELTDLSIDNNKFNKIDTKLKVLEDKCNLINSCRLNCFEKLTDKLSKKEEMDNMLMEATDENVERLIFRDIEVANSQCNDLRIRLDGYSASYEIVNEIVYILKEKLKLGRMDNSQLEEVSLVLDKYLKNISIENPENLIKTLKVFKAELSRVSKNSAMIDGVMRSGVSDGDSKAEDIQKYKMALLKQRNEKLNIESKFNGLDGVKTNNFNGGKNNGVF